MLAVNALYKLPKGEQMLQDAPELIEKVLPSPWICCTVRAPAEAARQRTNIILSGCRLLPWQHTPLVDHVQGEHHASPPPHGARCLL